MIDVDMTRIIVNQVKNLIQKRSKKNCISIFLMLTLRFLKEKRIMLIQSSVKNCFIH